jgi:hypothetical protein
MTGGQALMTMPILFFAIGASLWRDSPRFAIMLPALLFGFTAACLVLVRLSAMGSEQ